MKKLGIAFGVLLLLIGGAAFYVYGHLGALIKKGVESAGPPITGTDVTLATAAVSIFSGQGALRGLHIGNPKGFSDSDAFDLGKVELSVDPGSVTGPVVHVRSLIVEAPELLAEFDAGGRSNLDAILSHVRGAAGGGGSSRSGGAETRLVVDEFRFVNAQVRVLAPAYKLDRMLKLPPIQLKNLGGRQGLTPSQLSAEIMKPVVAAAAQAALAEYLKARGGGLLDKLLNK
jgi:hypothetical protein